MKKSTSQVTSGRFMDESNSANKESVVSKLQTVFPALYAYQYVVISLGKTQEDKIVAHFKL